MWLLICFLFGSIFEGQAASTINAFHPFNKEFHIDIDDATLSTQQIITKYGYPNDRQELITTDGYILSIFRLGARNSTMFPNPRSRSVLLVHDIATTAADFVILGPENALAYILADAGYDVWILNCRGSPDSSGHTKYESFLGRMPKQYWDFSIDEIGLYDVSSAIKHIIELTGFNNISLVTHSQGSAALYALLSENPGYNKFVNVHVSYAPAACMCGFPNILLRFAAFIEYFGLYSTLINIFGNFDLTPYMAGTKRVLVYLCSPGSLTQPICLFFYQFIFSYNDVVDTAFGIYSGHSPSDSSTRQYVHYAQLINNHACDFVKYKVWMFGSSQAYNLNNVDVPVHMFSGSDDGLVGRQGTLKLETKLKKNVVEHVSINGFGHEDFVLGRFAKENVYLPTLNILNKYNRL